MKINGWYRLWILLSIMYFVLVISFVIIEFPKAEKIPHEPNFYAKLSKQTAAMIIPDIYEDALALGYEIFDSTIHPTATKNERDVVRIEKKVEMPNGHNITFDAKFSEKEINIASQEYWKVVEQKATEKIRHLLLYAFLVWFVPCIALYILGRGIGWVYRGFKLNKLG